MALETHVQDAPGSQREQRPAARSGLNVQDRHNLGLAAAFRNWRHYVLMPEQFKLSDNHVIAFIATRDAARSRQFTNKP